MARTGYAASEKGELAVDGTFDRNIDRGNRNLALLGAGLLLLMPLIGLLFHQFVLYLVLGPEPADRAAILRSTPSSMPGQYMRIESVESVEIGEETRTTKYSTIPRVVARYHAVSIGGNLLVVRSKPGVKVLRSKAT